MTLLWIILGTLAAGIGSVWLAALLSFGALGRYTQHMLSLAAGALMATALLNLLPEAFESGVEPHDLFLTLLLGVVFFFLLDKAELWHHGHEHHHEHHHENAHGDHPAHAHGHGHGHDQHPVTGGVLGNFPASAQPSDLPAACAPASAPASASTSAPTGQVAGAWAVLAGDSVHCFGDGVLIASAFMADLRLGFIASLAVLAHEVPHHMGDLVVLRSGARNRRTALVKVSLAGAVTALGGMAGFWLLERLHDYLPYFLVAASSSFIYVALADLIPQLQKHLSARQTATQVAWLALGIGMVSLVAALAGGHGH